MPDPFAQLAQPWHDFYLLNGGAAATLSGLLFIAVTFGANLVKKETISTARAFIDPALLHFIQVLVIAGLMVMPVMTWTAVGSLLLAVAAFRIAGLGWVFVRLRRAHRENQDLEIVDWLLYIALPLVAYAFLVASAAGFLMKRPVAFSGLAVVTLSLMLIGIQAAWELIVWIASQSGSQTGQSSR